MSIFSTIKIALKAINANKLRAFLTMLGIIIGVASVITLVSIGQGASKAIEDKISALGSNLLIVVPRAVTINGVRQGIAKTLTLEDCYAIGNECNYVKYASPNINGNAQVVYGNENWNAIFDGVSKDYDKIGNWSISEGEFFTDEDVENANQVCLIGNTVLEELFKDDDPIDQYIRVKNIPFRVIGVLKPKNSSGSAEANYQDNFILMPYTTVKARLYKNKFLWSIYCSITSDKYTEEAIDEITTLLRQRHHLIEGAEDDFKINSQVDMIEKRTETTRMLTLFLLAIASISLLVGGIGIMNIMLVSVTERIREIGIRMSLGARGSDILKQFLLESMILSIIGGIIGIIIGIVLSKSIPNFVPDLQTFISTESIIISFIFSAGVGIFFGFYPAYKASKLNPIDALNHE